MRIQNRISITIHILIWKKGGIVLILCFNRRRLLYVKAEHVTVRIN
jgi:hypothetical protein